MEDTNKTGSSDRDAKAIRIEELEASWKRAVADYKNLERRFSEEKDLIVKFSNAVLLERLIPVLDNLEATSLHLKDQALAMSLKEFYTVLKDGGIEEIKAEGEEFDPLCMEASELVEGEENRVVKVVLKGYKFFDRILRPSRVVVGKKKV